MSSHFCKLYRTQNCFTVTVFSNSFVHLFWLLENGKPSNIKHGHALNQSEKSTSVAFIAVSDTVNLKHFM